MLEKLFPKGWMTKSGLMLSAFGGVLVFGLHAIGVGDVCTPEQILTGCETASELSQNILTAIGGLVSAFGVIVGWRGYKRAAQSRGADGRFN